MDWSKIKSIFIITFLILDVYLLYEFFKMIDLNEIEVQTHTEASIEKRLMADEIEYVSLPKNFVEDHYLKAKPKTFTEEDVQKKLLEYNAVDILNGTVLEVELRDPIKISEKLGRTELINYMKNNVLYGEEYLFWNISSDHKVITFYQHINGKQLFQNSNGELTFYLNDDSEIVSYRQTYLEEVQELSKLEKIIQPIKAIEILYTNGVLLSKSKIVDVDLGYYTLVPLSDTAQVLNPAWRFVVGDKYFFVSAFEGKIIDLNDKDKKMME